MTGLREEGWGMLRIPWLAAILLTASVGFAQQEIRAVRFWSLGGTTRIAVETDGPVQYRSGRLSNPDRIFFDLPGTLPAREHRRSVQVIPVDDGVVKQIRVALTKPGVTRVVIDLACPAEFAASQLANPDRLMIEVRGAGAFSAPVSRGPEKKTSELTLEPPVLASGPLPTSRPPAFSESQPGGPPATVNAPRETAAPVAQAAAAKAPEPPAPLVARSAQRDSRGGRSLIRALGLKVGRIVLDPGHGGHDTGTIGPGGLKEKDLVLDIALRLGQLITERMGAEVIYTRTDDTFVPLETRTEIANEAKADLFLSIHANSSRLRTAAGPETFYLNFTTDPNALEVAARENAPSTRSIHELQDLVLKIARKEKVQESREFAASIQKALYSGLRSGKNRGIKKAPFVVLIGAQMPSVLVEVAFLSNPREERLLKQPDYRQRLAEALYRGLFQYASTLSHFQLARSANP
jgi:N-acetylmuramoyl-L-alanine amidase